MHDVNEGGKGAARTKRTNEVLLPGSAMHQHRIQWWHWGNGCWNHPIWNARRPLFWMRNPTALWAGRIWEHYRIIRWRLLLLFARKDKRGISLVSTRTFKLPLPQPHRTRLWMQRNHVFVWSVFRSGLFPPELAFGHHHLDQRCWNRDL